MNLIRNKIQDEIQYARAGQSFFMWPVPCPYRLFYFLLGLALLNHFKMSAPI